MDETPLISVLTAAYNGAAHLPALIESVRNQSYDHFEHLVLDDGSSDAGATAAVLSHYPHLRAWRQENAGQYAAQNVLLDAARGDIVLIINQDDLLAGPEVFSSVIDAWRANPDADIVYGNVRYVDSAGSPLPYRYAYEKARSRWLLRRVSCIPHIGLYVRRALIERHRLRFDPALQMAGDWDWFLHVERQAGAIVHVPAVLARFRLHGAQKTTSRGERGFAPEVHAICRRHRINPLINALLRRWINLRVRLATLRAMTSELGWRGTFRRGFVFLRARFGNGGNRSS